MFVIRHRMNDLKSLKALPPDAPVEVDIHAFGDTLTVHHDALSEGVSFQEWLLAAGNRFAIFNIKEEGIEDRVIAMAESSKIDDFFLLDLSFPSLIKMIKRGEKRVALRVSEYEHYSVAVELGDALAWVWLDCFEGFPLDARGCEAMNNAPTKICLVSPELHGPHRCDRDVISFQRQMSEHGLKIDAVCTKSPNLWLQRAHKDNDV
jgi:hypothetical protein